MSNIIVCDTKFDDLKVLKNHLVSDNRGSLMRLFCLNTLRPLLKKKEICQINKTHTAKKGTVRGLHFQYSPYAETKIITCLKGKIWDVAVDLRKGSPTFLQYHSEILSESNNKSVLIPEGFAHGYQSLSSNSEMLYLHTEYYNLKAEGAVNITDPIIDIKWPLKIADWSNKDKNHPLLNKNFQGIQN